MKIATHPTYSGMTPLWTLCAVSYQGEAAVKAKRDAYLPATSGQKIDMQEENDKGPYNAYLARAVYPSEFEDAVAFAIGIMHRKPPKIYLPDSMKVLERRCSDKNESIAALLRRINTEQLITGRIGLLGDMDVLSGKVMPKVSTYNAESILNWGSTKPENQGDADFVVLNESGPVATADFNWEDEERYRLLTFDGEGFYASVTFTESPDMSALTAPHKQGEKIKGIPFAFVNASDLSPAPDKPPLLGLANTCMAIYRGEADYRQALFLQGQETLVTKGYNGDSDNIRTGTGAHIEVTANGDAKYIGVSANGLSEQRQALENDYTRAADKSGKLSNTSNRAESGESLKTRIAAQTATLPQIAQAGAAGLESVLKEMAPWFNADPEEIRIEPNLEFAQTDVHGKDLLDIVNAKNLGAPISLDSIHEWMRGNGLTKYTLEEELERIQQEEPAL